MECQISKKGSGMLSTACPVTQLGLRSRTLRMLAGSDVTTVAQLIACTETELRLRSLDDKAIIDVVECLAINALALRIADVASTSAVSDTAVVASEVADAESELFVDVVEPGRRSRLSDSLDLDPLAESAIADGDLEQLERAFHGIQLRKKGAAKAATLTDDRRANAFAERVAEKKRRKSAGPSRDDARIAELRETITLTVDEAAYLYNVSRDAIYDAIKRPGVSSIPYTRIGKRIVIPTRHVFGDLGLE